jgi:hypothetical protein
MIRLRSSTKQEHWSLQKYDDPEYLGDMKPILTGTEDRLMAETAPEGLSLGPAVTLPIEIYGEKRIAEFDAVEADLDKVLRRRRLPSR